MIGDETITLDSARCFLEEQDAAAGGGKILFVAQGFGTNAAGEQLVSGGRVEVGAVVDDQGEEQPGVHLETAAPFSQRA